MSEKKQVLGYVHSTESFGAVDGPGIRFVVFLQGCKMRCKYCHNPETWNLVTDYSKLYSDETSDAEREELEKKIEENTKLLKDKGVKIEARTPEDLLKQALRYKPYWKNGGGITVSGGEALLQMDFLIEFFKLAKAEGIHTTIDTAGNPFTREEPFFSKFNELMNLTDLFLLISSRSMMTSIEISQDSPTAIYLILHSICQIRVSICGSDTYWYQPSQLMRMI